ncbi:Doubled CXXCH motif (Paired_CXXCH_1) [Pirellulimonas nuda]|uniref:Doubled CXXCH motif (Paired_CXXCH_1) n=1 Tax=Pirellulimonas nuda TaxID=2528009 RepID=A0A518DE91_9BACT|nr:cytochrome c3 family protein [Pirellulimonas nuda]QDU89798.1 Doubled CXXCH motif (Paired_CXXCH_1) [Pirellulimonas nuda]
MTRRATPLLARAARAIALMVVAAAALPGCRPSDGEARHAHPAPPAPASVAAYQVNIRRPSGPPLIELAGADPQGRAASVACSTCHSVRKPNLENKTAASLDEFHQGLTVNHGALACYACHSPDNADTLRLADGTTVEYVDVMTLCSQCHSKQAESFAHGAHGGMNGFWDLSRGPQTKNNCIDCHDPHAPKYPKMVVDFKPHDRFLDASEEPHDRH